MTAEAMVARLDRVKQTGPGRWIARCPAHEDRSPSLSVRELEDGRTLLKCFAGCQVDAVVGAMGLRMGDLFPPRPASYEPQARRGFNALDVLHCIAHESVVVLIAARTLEAGEPLHGADAERLSLAIRRLDAAVEVAHAA